MTVSDCSRKHIVVTGASSGIGAATAATAADQGWHVFALDRTPSRQAGDNVSPLTVDITSESEVAAAAQAIDAHVGVHGIDALANIAGIGVPGPLETMPIADLRKSLEVDVLGQVAVTQALLPAIRTAAGRIVFIGSIADRVTMPFFGALSSAKSAIAAVSDTFRQELAPWGIDVILVEPGFIKTGADEATKALIDKRIASFTPAQAELYGEMFKEMTVKGYQTQEEGSPPQGVADTILHAFTVRDPRLHYLVGADSHTVSDMARLPQRVQDALKRRAFGLPHPGSEEASQEDHGRS